MSISDAVSEYNKTASKPYALDGQPKATKKKETETNSLGLPEGSPDNIEGIKAAMKAKGVKFHHLAKEKKLVAIYRAEVLKEEPTDK